MKIVIITNNLAESKYSWVRERRNKTMEVPNNRGQNLNLKRFLLMDIGYQMKMQLRKILILPAVDDQAIGGELKIIHKALDCGIQVRKKGGI